MKLYGIIEKVEDQDDGTIIVTGFASSESVDCDGEIIKASAMSAALPDYMKFANIREMHQSKAAGVALEAAVQDDGRTWLKTHIVDAGAVQKVKTGVYKGFSIGGRVTDRDEANKSIITGIRLSEISLVDRPANPNAVLECWKGDGIEQENTMTDEEKQQQESEAASKAAQEQADADKVSAKAAAFAELKKYMGEEVYDAGNAINALSAVMGILMGEMSEDENSPEQIADLKAAADKLKAFIASEIMEDNAPQAEGEDDVAYAARCANLAKRGARHSKQDAKTLQDIHDHASAIHKGCMSLGMGSNTDKADDADDLAKLSGDLTAKGEALAKVEAENADLKKRITELEAMPRPIKGALQAVAVEKSLDSNAIAQAESVEELVKKAVAANDPDALIKLTHQHGGKKITL